MGPYTGVPALTIPCLDTADDVYITPAALPPFDPSVLGDVVRCTSDGPLSADDVSDRLVDAGIEGVTPLGGASVYRIAYRTTRWASEAGIGSARLYLPEVLPTDGPLPIVVAGHGTIGLADTCAPSLYPQVGDDLALPFVAAGFVVVSPDYAGLGTDGTQGYGENNDTGHSMIDAVRAARSILEAGVADAGSIAMGHSQGGGSALSAHALDGSYGDGDLIGAIPFAPGWIDNTDSIAAAANWPYLVPWSGTFALATTLSFYSDAANHLGPGQEVSYFRESVADQVETLVTEDCLVGLVLGLPGLAATLGGVADPDFLASVASCAEGGDGCAPPGQGYIERMEATILEVDPASGPILIVAGMQDASNTPEGLACKVERMEEAGITPQLCLDEDAVHMDIVTQRITDAVAWALALAAVDPLPECEPVPLPDCG